MARDPLTESVIGLAIEVHKTLGPGPLESVYESCLSQELTAASIKYQRQVVMPVWYKGTKLDSGFRADLIIEDQLLIEVKATEGLAPLHEAQVLTYLRLGNLSKGLLINFNTPLLKDGVRRFAM